MKTTKRTPQREFSFNEQPCRIKTFHLSLLLQNKSLDVVTKEKKKKKRKPRLPKNYDPSTTPDPERWLPLKERSYYRKSRRKGGATAVRGTQGSSAASASLMTQLDASKPQVMKTTAGDSVSGGIYLYHINTYK